MALRMTAATSARWCVWSAAFQRCCPAQASLSLATAAAEWAAATSASSAAAAAGGGGGRRGGGNARAPIAFAPAFLATAAAVAREQEQEDNDSNTDVDVKLNVNIKDQQPAASNSHTARWRVYTDVGTDLFSQGRLGEAERYLTRALQEARDGFGDADPHVAAACNNLAELYRVQKDYDKAEPLYREAIERLTTACGPSHQSLGLALHNLGGFYLLQGFPDRALDCYQIKGTTFGTSHREYASTLFHCAEVYYQLYVLGIAQSHGRGTSQTAGHLSEAVDKMMQAVTVLENAGTTPKVLLKRASRLAEVSLVTFLQCTERSLGASFAQLLIEAERLEEAEVWLRKVLELVKNEEGTEALSTATAQENLASCLHLRGGRSCLDEARALLQSCLDIRKGQLKPFSLKLPETLIWLALVELDAAASPDAGMEEGLRLAGRAREVLRGAADLAESASSVRAGQDEAMQSPSLPSLVHIQPRLLLVKALLLSAEADMVVARKQRNAQASSVALKEAEATIANARKVLNELPPSVHHLDAVQYLMRACTLIAGKYYSTLLATQQAGLNDSRRKEALQAIDAAKNIPARKYFGPVVLLRDLQTQQ
eukprot:jgi/Chlat1/9210/Chrsp97S08411